MRDTISIIIPTCNEALLIENLLARLRSFFPETEVVVADGGSEDETVARASRGALVVSSAKGRAAQMNAGARAVSGNILWFLHADCWPSERSCELISACLANPGVVGGGFRWGIDGSRWYYGPFTAIAHVKNKIRRNLYGDMGIFVRRSVFDRLGGYAEIPIFEEVEFNRRLKKQGKTIILDEVLLSSDRKLVAEGPMKAFIKNHILKMAYRLGFSPEYLKKFY